MKSALPFILLGVLAVPTVHAARNLAVTAAAPGGGASRVALVVGNKDYPDMPLSNPVNDARAMKKALEQVGFQVIYQENADLEAMDAAVKKFVQNLRKDSVGLFYYSGHGAQADGSNFLIPAGARIDNKAALKSRAFDTGIVLGGMEEAGNRVNIVILDACRNNPFKGFRAAVGGLASMSGPEGSLIAFATAPGDAAADGSGANGTYTKYLVRALVRPGRKIEDMFKQVRQAVRDETGGDQVPWENSSLLGDFCFAGCEGGGAADPVEPPPAKPDPAAEERDFWGDMKDSTDPADFGEYLNQYPRGRFAGLARNRIKRLSQVASAPPETRPVVAGPPPRPEPARSMAALIGERYLDDGDGTVTDTQTGLQWMRCDLGQTWNWGACTGEHQEFTFDGIVEATTALNRSGGYAGYRDWRVPTLKELQSLVRPGSRPAIDGAVFPGAPPGLHWSCPSPVGYAYYAWIVYFDPGYSNCAGRNDGHAVRLVRGGR